MRFSNVHSRVIILFAASLLIIPLALNWDAPLFYQAFSFIVLGFSWGVSFRKTQRIGSSLWIFTAVTCITGLFLWYFPTSFTVELMMSGAEFINLAGVGAVFICILELTVRKNPGSASFIRILPALIIIGFSVFLTGISRSFTLPAPNGVYSIGTTAYRFTDYNTAEPFTSDPQDVRSLILQISYPASNSEAKPGMPYRNSSRITTNSVKDIRPADGAFPVILYSAGAGGSRFDNTWLVESLVSSGYIIVAIDHTFLNSRRKFRDSTFMSLSKPEYLSKIEHGIRVQDLKNVYQHLFSKEFKQRFPNIAPSKCGVIGWSVGGSAALEFAQRNAGVGAIVNLDGWDFMPLDNDVSFQNKGLLIIKSDISNLSLLNTIGTGLSLAQIDSLDRRQSSREEDFFGRYGARGYSIRVAEAFHSNFRDHGILNLSRLGPIDAEICGKLTNELVVSFFDHHLRSGEDNIKAIIAEHPELSIEYSR